MQMLKTVWTAGLVLVVLVVLAVGYRWWASDERAITRQLDALAGALSVTGQEGELGPITRIAALRKVLAPDLQVSAVPAPSVSGMGAGTPMTLVGRDQALALVSRWIPPPGGMTVAFVDVDVSVGDDRVSAEVSCTATVTSRPTSGERAIEAHELSMRLTKTDGTWLLARVQTEDPLAR